MTRLVITALLLAGSMLAAALDAAPAQAADEIGINRTGLSMQSPAVQQKTLADIHALGATWFRDGPSSGSPRGVANFVAEMKLAKQQGLKVLIIVMPMDEDYDGALPLNRCGWREKRLSAINLDKYTARLRALLAALRAADLAVDAAEFGSEADQYCYDADVPRGHAGSASRAEIQTWLRGYGRFLRAGVAALHEPRAFPAAKVITFGLAHSGDYRADDAFPQPARLIAMLRNVDGFNYLDNAEYHVDGYGTHLYPSPNDIVNATRALLREDETALGRDKPLWITEFGFLEIRAFPNRSGQSLSQCVQLLLETLGELHHSVPIGPEFFYRYDVWLSDAAGNLQPPARVLAAYATKR